MCAGSVVGVAAIGIAAAHPGDKGLQKDFALGTGGWEGAHGFQLFLAQGQMTQPLEISTQCAGVMAPANQNVTEMGR
jgi:hypothetical protein